MGAKIRHRKKKLSLKSALARKLKAVGKWGAFEYALPRFLGTPLALIAGFATGGDFYFLITAIPFFHIFGPLGPVICAVISATIMLVYLFQDGRALLKRLNHLGRMIDEFIQAPNFRRVSLNLVNHLRSIKFSDIPKYIPPLIATVAYAGAGYIGVHAILPMVFASVGIVAPTFIVVACVIGAISLGLCFVAQDINSYLETFAEAKTKLVRLFIPKGSPEYLRHSVNEVLSEERKLWGRLANLFRKRTEITRKQKATKMSGNASDGATQNTYTTLAPKLGTPESDSVELESVRTTITGALPLLLTASEQYGQQRDLLQRLMPILESSSQEQDRALVEAARQILQNQSGDSGVAPKLPERSTEGGSGHDYQYFGPDLNAAYI